LLTKLPIRLIVSVIAGLVTSTVLSFITHEFLHLAGILPAPTKPMFDTKPLFISLFYHSVYAVIGAIITAKIAEEKVKKAVFILGTKEAIMWLLGIILLWKHTPAWFNITKAVIGIPLAMLGGKIYTIYKTKKSNKEKTDKV
jgi:hypothetical protein